MSKKGRKSLKKRIPLEEMGKRIFVTHGNDINISNYTMAHAYANFHCNICGNNWIAIAESVARENGCPECRKIKASKLYRKSIEEVIKYFAENNCKYLSGEYINGRSKLEIQFECSHIAWMNFNDFRDGNRCPQCRELRMRQTIGEKTKNKVLEFLESIDYKLISFSSEIVNWNTDVIYKCRYGHVETRNVRMLLRGQSRKSPEKCKECTKIWQTLNQTGSKGSNWQGGLTDLKSFLSKYIKDWKKKSIANSNYRCVISGERFDDVHHIQSFNLILKESIADLGFELKETVGEYLEEELFLLVNKIKELHEKYPGVALKRSWHKKFHQIFGMGDNTPEQWSEFLYKISLSEIQV